MFQKKENILMEEQENQKLRVNKSWLNLIGWLIQIEQKSKDL